MLFFAFFLFFLYDEQVFLSMLSRIFFLILAFSLSFSGVFAQCSNESTIDKANFRLDVGCMGPVPSGPSADVSGGIPILTAFLGRFADLLLFLIPIMAAVSFLIAGYYYIFSAGNSEKVGRAKTIIKWNIVAMTVALLSYGIVRLIAQFFS